MGLTESQKAALALDKNISVTAGAGSGKTRILVERFLKIVLQQPHLTRSVVAITFTEKAASEMQERVAEDVSLRLKKEKLATDERLKLQNIRDQLNSAYISTIHGFCMRILREFPIEAGVSPDFSILDPIRQKVLLSNSIKEVFLELDSLTVSDNASDWINLFLAIPRRRLIDMLESALQKPFEMQQIIKQFKQRSRDEYIDFLEKNWLAVFNRSVINQNIENAAMLAEEILNHDKVPLENKLPKAQEIYHAAIKLVDAFNKDPNSVLTKSAFLLLSPLLVTTKNKAYSNLTFLGKKESWSIAVHAPLLNLSDMFAPVRSTIVKMDPGSAPDEADLKWYDIFIMFLELHKRVEQKYTEIKNDAAVLDFEDLQLFTLHLLTTNTQIREKLHKRFRYIMVDEFQDTNAIQWQIVKCLAMENVKIASDQVFVVGDPKQSIYGFRDADIRVFKKVIDLFAQNAGSMFAEMYDGNIVFRESFRFVPRLNAFINHYFDQILKEDSANLYEVGYEKLNSERHLPEAGSIKLAVFDEEKGKNEADFMAYTIDQLLQDKSTIWEWTNGKEVERPIEFGDIAILIRDRSHLLEIEQALRLKNVPFKTVGGIGFWQRQEIYDFYHILRFLANPADDLALIGLLRSRLFLLPDTVIFSLSQEKEIGYLQRINGALKFSGYTSEEKTLLKNAAAKINKWLKYRERLTLGELLNIIVEDTQLFALMNAEFSGEQRTANLQKIINLAENFDQSGPGGLRSFLNTIDDLINREVSEGEAFLALEDRTSVKIMTIHVSKGLQFPVVFTPYLNRSMRSGGVDVLMDAELGMAVTFKNIDDFQGSKATENTLYRLLSLKQKQKDLAELKRIFYVGVSRASNYLFLSASSKGDKAARDSMFGLLADCLVKEGINPFEPRNVNLPDFSFEIINNYQEHNIIDRQSQSFSSFLRKITDDSQAESDHFEMPPLAQQLKTETSGRIFSATALMTFIRNPSEYYNQYHLGFFEDDYKRFAKDRTSDGIDSLLKGKIVHRFLELYQSSKIDPKLLLQQIVLENEIYDQDTQASLINEMLSILEQVKTSSTASKILAAKNYRNEISLTMELGDDFITGTIDRLQRNEDGFWEVFDYKTNRITENELSIAGQEYKIQMESYALLLSRLYPEQENFPVSLYFLAIDKTYRENYNLSDIKRINKSFSSIIQQIKEKYPVF